MLTVRRSRVFHGPSIWAPTRAIVLDVDFVPLEERLRKETPAFFEPLTALVPALIDDAARVNDPEGGLQRLLLDRLALALQNHAGATVTYAQTIPTADAGVSTVTFAYEHEEVGLAAGLLAVRLLNHLIVKSEPTFNFNRELEQQIVKVAKRLGYHRLTRFVVAAAERRGIPVLRLEQDPAIIQLSTGRYQRRIINPGTVTSSTSDIAVTIGRDKALTTRLLREAGLPVPRDAVVSDVEAAVQAAARIGYPVVVKPLSSNNSRGVTVDIREELSVREAFPLAVKECRRGQAVVEQHISGANYRVVVINDQIMAVGERVPAHVIGDGTHTVAELIEVTNQDPRRGVYREAIWTRIAVDQQTIDMLAKQELALDAAPAAGRFVQLKPLHDGRFGGTYADRTDVIHPDNAEIARQAAMVVGLDVAGIDLITPDITRSVYERGGAVNEVNSHPGIAGHLHPADGQPRDVAMALVDALFPPGQPSRVPIVAVSGTTGTTSTTRMIAHIMKTAGRQVGMTTRDGMYIKETRIASGDQSGPESAQKILRNPGVDLAVCETGREGILRAGLGFERCDVAVVTNVSCENLSPFSTATAEELARIDAVVSRSVAPDGASVLNADDQWTVAMAETAGGEVIFFSRDEESSVVHDHLRQGGTAVVLREAPSGLMLTLLEGSTETSLLLTQEIPVSASAECTDVDAHSAMAAAAAAFAQGVPASVIADALRTVPLTGA